MWFFFCLLCLFLFIFYPLIEGIKMAKYWSSMLSVRRIRSFTASKVTMMKSSPWCGPRILVRMPSWRPNLRRLIPLVTKDVCWSQVRKLHSSPWAVLMYVFVCVFRSKPGLIHQNCCWAVVTRWIRPQTLNREVPCSNLLTRHFILVA